MGSTLATSTIKMCPFGGTDPQDRGRTGWASWCSCVCGMFFIWARVVLPACRAAGQVGPGLQPPPPVGGYRIKEAEINLFLLSANW